MTTTGELGIRTTIIIRMYLLFYMIMRSEARKYGSWGFTYWLIINTYNLMWSFVEAVKKSCFTSDLCLTRCNGSTCPEYLMHSWKRSWTRGGQFLDLDPRVWFLVWVWILPSNSLHHLLSWSDSWFDQSFPVVILVTFYSFISKYVTDHILCIWEAYLKQLDYIFSHFHLHLILNSNHWGSLSDSEHEWEISCQSRKVCWLLSSLFLFLFLLENDLWFKEVKR
jgi:hypothetical protein